MWDGMTIAIGSARLEMRTIGIALGDAGLPPYSCSAKLAHAAPCVGTDAHKVGSLRSGRPPLFKLGPEASRRAKDHPHLRRGSLRPMLT